MNSLKKTMYLIVLAGAVLLIVFSNTYIKTSHYMRGVSYIQESAYKR